MTSKRIYVTKRNISSLWMVLSLIHRLSSLLLGCATIDPIYSGRTPFQVTISFARTKPLYDKMEGRDPDCHWMMQSTLSQDVLNIMRKGMAPFFLKDYTNMESNKGYWCRLGYPDMKAHNFMLSKTSITDVYILVNIYHFHCGVRFPLHPFLDTLCCMECPWTS